MTVSFVAANDVALTKSEDDSSLMELKSHWLEDYREILELVQEDKAEAFKEAKSLWTDISVFSKPKSTNGSSGVTRSVIELRDAVMKLMLSLALQIEEHQFIIDTCLKSVDMLDGDAGLWDTLGKAMMAMGTFTPAALRLVLEKQVVLSPSGSISAKSRLYKLLESIGDYESLSSINDKAKDMLFRDQDGQLVPRYELTVPEKIQFGKPRVRTAVLHERTWTALLDKLVQLYEDDEMLLVQPLRLSVTQDEPVVSQLTKDMNTLAMSFSRRPSIEDLATRTSKRRKDTGGSAPKKTKQQLYEELDLEGFFGTLFGISGEDLMRIISKAHQPTTGSSGQDLVPLDLFSDCQSHFRTKEPALIFWIQHTLGWIEGNNGPIDESCAFPYLAISDSQPDVYYLKRCYALCSAKPAGWRLSVRETLSKIESDFINKGNMEPDNTFACHYHFILGVISENPKEALFYFNSCKAKLLKNSDLVGFRCFGFTLDIASIDHLISKIMFKTKLDDMKQHMNDPSWFKVHLFNDTDLGDPAACLEQISAADLHEEIILSTLQMLMSADLCGKAHRWLAHGFQLAMTNPSMSRMINSFVKLSDLALPLMAKHPTSTFDKSIVEPLVLCSWLLRDGAEYEDKDSISMVLARLWPALSIINPSISEFSWRFLSIGLAKSPLTEFLRNLCNVKGLSTTVGWNALRVLNGINSPFEDADDPFGQMEPLGTLDMKKTSAKSFEKVHMPLETLRSVLAYQKDHGISDVAKYAELLEFLTTGLARSCSSVVKTNTGILERHITAPIEECFKAKNIKLYTGNDLDVQVGKGLYNRVKHLNELIENKKRTAQLVRAWRDDLVKSLCCQQSQKTWNLLAELSMEVINLGLSEDMDHIYNVRDELFGDLRVALVSLSQIKEKSEGLSKIFLLLLEGPLQFLRNDEAISDVTLQKIFLQVCKPSPGDDLIVMDALVQAARGYPDQLVQLLMALLKRTPSNEAYEQRFHLALSLLELVNNEPDIADKTHIGPELVRLGLIDEDHKDASIAEWALEIGSRDKKKVQHRHLFLKAQIEPSLNSWSALFPFLTKNKSAGYVNVWQCDQDLPGMHLCYKAKYTKAMLSWLAGNESADMFTLACKKAVANLFDMYDPDDIVAHGLNLIPFVKSRLPEADISQAFNILKKVCDDKNLIMRLKSELDIF